MSYDLYIGPCDEDECVSDSIFLSQDWLNKLFKESGIENYNLNSAENYHILYIENDELAKSKFKSLLNNIKSQGFKIIRDCY
jgi:rhamnogalacturonyl hydrolase YesR